MIQKLWKMKILTTYINPISHLGIAYRAHLKILDVVFIL